MAVRKQGRVGLFAVAVALLVVSGQTLAEDRTTDDLWSRLAQRDIEAVAKVLSTESIQAYTTPSFQRDLQRAIQLARQDAKKVKGLPDHLVMLDRLAARFNDAHLFAVRHAEPSTLLWPGFSVNWTAGGMRVMHSTRPDIPVGAEIAACDGVPVARWSSRRALEMGISPRADDSDQALETTLSRLAERSFADVEQSLYKPWTRCTFNGVERALQWHGIDRVDWLKLRPSPQAAALAQVRPLGQGEGLWVVLPDFAPSTREAKAAFLALIEQAKSWRDQPRIVLDVRGNPGGSYEWFVGLLNALYGADYTAHYARARLQIDPLILLPEPVKPTKTARAAAAETADPEAAQGLVPEPPLDAPKDHVLDRSLREAKPQPIKGRVLLQVKSVDKAASGPAPLNPVKGQVLVLTDSLCQSSCIAFVDEMKRFPGVRQVGRETGVDSRTGTPNWRTLPSGLVTWAWPTMTRPGRERDDNRPHQPVGADRYTGDLLDQAALERWVLSLGRF